MFAAIHVHDFFLQAALRPEPQLHSRPVALLDPAASHPVIFQLTESARQAGITVDERTESIDLRDVSDVCTRFHVPALELDYGSVRDLASGDLE